MRCEACQGTGYLPIKSLGLSRFVSNGMYYGKLPCPECDGCGVAHCCEGDQCTDDRPKFKQYKDTYGPPRKELTGKKHEAL